MAKKAELSDEDVTQIEELRSRIPSGATQLEHVLGVLARVFKQTHKLVSGGFKDDAAGNKQLREMGGLVAEVQKDFKKWKSIEQKILDTLDALVCG